ncbi:hypothetical protein KFE25_006827 [Diacronema lutheri]|uniref:Uncharacterized protein n=1 Tax=Diacronema lutheri TaxID=2081491 RepID=A0A8J5XTS2_DIALT|nr:hypothetical protein KFE25_006827 [Diacronema lutheri]
MPNAMAHHMTTCVALALCSLPKASSMGYRHPRARAGGRLAGSHSLSARAAAAPIAAALGGGLGGGVVPPRGGDGRGDSDGGASGPEDGAEPGPGLSSAFFAWLLSDQYRRAAVAGASWAAAVTWSVQLARHEADAPMSAQLAGTSADAAAAAAARTPAAFSGEWVLSGSENFDAYLTSMGVSALHRRYACAASVSQTIETGVEEGSPVLTVCVRNQLGTRCERCAMDGRPVRSVDVRGAAIVKVFSLTKPNRGECAPVCVTELRHSRNGVMYERRYLRADGAMVMELTSPSGIVARRIFTRAEPRDERPELK